LSWLVASMGPVQVPVRVPASEQVRGQAVRPVL
jgi:hypothetical protein